MGQAENLMQMKYNLFVDKEFALKFAENVQHNLILMPGLESARKVRIENKYHSAINSGIVKLNNSIAASFAKNIYNRKLGLDIDASRFLYYGFGTTISFLLADRLIRINQLLGYNDIDQIQVPCPLYKYNKNISFLEFFYAEVERNPVFNQWVIANILSKNKLDNRKNSDNIDSRIVPEFKKLRKQFAKRGYILFYRISSRLFLLKTNEKKKIKKTPFFSFGYLSDVFNESNVIKPESALCELPSFSPIWVNFYRKDIITSDSELLIDEISKEFKKFITEQCERINLPEYVYKNLAKLVICLQPNTVNRDLKKNALWALNIFRKFDNGNYLTDTTTSNPLSCLYLFAARTYKRKVISCQHSAWGGYFANGSLVSENLILGAHYYVTFGWDEPDKKLSYWETGNYNLPSPLYSKMRHTSFKRVTKNKNLKIKPQKILLCPGFLNRFPSVYNSSLRIDVIDYWRDIICDIIKTCIKHGFKVELKFYNNKFDDDFKALKELWLSLGSKDEICEYKDHNSRIRYILNSDDYDYDFIIWDLPAGGFSECLTTFNKTIALSSPVLHEYYPSDNQVIEELINCGLLFQDSCELSNTLTGINKNSQWFDDPFRVQAIGNFQKKYAMVNEDWEIKWRNFIMNLQQETIFEKSVD